MLVHLVECPEVEVNAAVLKAGAGVAVATAGGQQTQTICQKEGSNKWW